MGYSTYHMLVETKRKAIIIEDIKGDQFDLVSELLWEMDRFGMSNANVHEGGLSELERLSKGKKITRIRL